jgi:5'-AMP-activated protein kinase catalytic alpha subunit
LFQEWKILSPYKLKARYPPQPDVAELSLADDNAVVPAPPKLVKMGLQLYKTPRSRYVLDVQKLFGETFVFMNLCARLMTELRI